LVEPGATLTGPVRAAEEPVAPLWHWAQVNPPLVEEGLPENPLIPPDRASAPPAKSMMMAAAMIGISSVPIRSQMLDGGRPDFRADLRARALCRDVAIMTPPHQRNPLPLPVHHLRQVCECLHKPDAARVTFSCHLFKLKICPVGVSSGTGECSTTVSLSAGRRRL